MGREIPADAGTVSARPPIARGWVLWLTWLFALVFASEVLYQILLAVVGSAQLGAMLGVTLAQPHVTVWWVLNALVQAVFGVACVGILLHDRDMARLARGCAWLIVGLQCIGAFSEIVHAHIQVPLGALLYGAFAIGLGSALGSPKAMAAPPGARGML